ncbi:CUB and sushi domain-containing protein 2-like [Halichondria panicea]|uniref:CUB and sushi domain-containing protein 2-like n=1 Tax=Halichondria panicea TaxID=6063 RepID=UPI00312B6F39
MDSDCTFSDCGPLSPPTNGSVVTPSGTSTGNLGSYSCDNGLVLNGFSIRFCDNSGLWTPEDIPSCGVPTCGQLPELVNGDLSLSDNVNEGSVATYTCDTGFNLTGSITRTCTTNGGWTLIAPVCLRAVADCGPLSPPTNGSVVTPSGTTTGNFGSYSCDNGLVLNGFSIRFFPTCGQLPDLVNGDLSLSDDVNEGSVATYTCDEGFILTGSITRTCTTNRGWTLIAPVCLRAVPDCGLLSPPPNGNVATPSGTTAGNVALYSCAEGLVLTGSTVRVCRNNALWIPEAPTCEAQPTQGPTLAPLILNCSAEFLAESQQVSVSCTSSRDLDGLDFECSFNNESVTEGCGQFPFFVSVTGASGSHTIVISATDSADGAGFTSNITITITAPEIETQPESVGVEQGGSASFTVEASGAGLTYQWFGPGGVALTDSDGEIEGSTSGTLTVFNAEPGDAGDYTVVVTNSAGSVTSDAASLSIGPAIDVQPSDVNTAEAGGTATFTMEASGEGLLSYQWFGPGRDALTDVDGDIEGSNSSTLQIINVESGDAGDYTVVVTNSAGSVVSDAATLSIGEALL